MVCCLEKLNPSAGGESLQGSPPILFCWVRKVRVRCRDRKVSRSNWLQTFGFLTSRKMGVMLHKQLLQAACVMFSQAWRREDTMSISMVQ